MDELGNKKIYLYSHSPEAGEAVEAGNAKLSTGGIRRNNGTILDPPTPLAFTVDELKAMLSDDSRIQSMDVQIAKVSNKLELSQQTVQQLTENAWLNHALTGQMYAMTSAGFQRTLDGIAAISAKLDKYAEYVRHRDMADLQEKMNRYIANLKSDAGKLVLPKFDVTNSQVDEHLNETAAFIEHQLNELATEHDNGYLRFQIIHELIRPVAYVTGLFFARYFFDNEVKPGNYDSLIDVINKTAGSTKFANLAQYYINLELDIPYRDKVRLGSEVRSTLKLLPRAMAFNEDYVIHHSEKEYFSRDKELLLLLEKPEELPEDGKICL
jgi:hypothetical protein